jgi:hypothetical protein
MRDGRGGWLLVVAARHRIWKGIKGGEILAGDVSARNYRPEEEEGGLMGTAQLSARRREGRRYRFGSEAIWAMDRNWRWAERLPRGPFLFFSFFFFSAFLIISYLFHLCFKRVQTSFKSFQIILATLKDSKRTSFHNKTNSQIKLCKLAKGVFLHNPK